MSKHSKARAALVNWNVPYVGGEGKSPGSEELSTTKSRELDPAAPKGACTGL